MNVLASQIAVRMQWQSASIHIVRTIQKRNKNEHVSDSIFNSIMMIEHCFVYLAVLYRRRSKIFKEKQCFLYSVLLVTFLLG